MPPKRRNDLPRIIYARRHILLSTGAKGPLKSHRDKVDIDDIITRQSSALSAQPSLF